MLWRYKWLPWVGDRILAVACVILSIFIAAIIINLIVCLLFKLL